MKLVYYRKVIQYVLMFLLFFLCLQFFIAAFYLTECIIMALAMQLVREKFHIVISI